MNKACTVMEACDIASVSRRTLYNWMGSGKLNFLRTPGGSRRILIDDLYRDRDGQPIPPDGKDARMTP